ncbi:MAG: hypothetical protein JW936_04450 [Sedimentisphaerales bacterium]|nr:hypothetical protein [Sedimentisphaerales bacterium]
MGIGIEEDEGHEVGSIGGANRTDRSASGTGLGNGAWRWSPGARGGEVKNAQRLADARLRYGGKKRARNWISARNCGAEMRESVGYGGAGFGR